jgi:hypothetical protein
MRFREAKNEIIAIAIISFWPLFLDYNHPFRRNDK